MKTTIHVAALAAAILALAGPMALAQGDAVLVRLVAADNSEAGDGNGELADVLPLLKDNLRFKSYQLLASGKVATGGTQPTAVGLGYSILVTKQGANTFSVDVSKGGRSLVKTRVILAPRQPVMLGGFPYNDDGKVIVVVSLP